MTQTDKDLLLKDLCARVPYGVKVRCKIPINQNESKEFIGQVTSVHYNVSIVQVGGFDVIADYNPYFEIKPYLFPMSSMTEEQKKELDNMFKPEDDICEKIKTDNFEFNFYRKSIFDFLNKYHLDWRGLIPMGLANDATGLNIY